MKVIEAARMVLELPSHHELSVEIDGFDCDIVEAQGNGRGNACVVCDLPEGYRMLPDEPTDAMLDACGRMGLSPAQMRVLWATMVRAHDVENE